MNQLKVKLHQAIPGIQMLLTMVWLANLAATDAYFSVYVLIAFLSFSLQVKHFAHPLPFSRKESVLAGMAAIVFSILVLAANYPLFTTIGDPAVISRNTSLMVNLINSALSILGGVATAYPLLYSFFCLFPVKAEPASKVFDQKWIPFAVYFGLLFVNLIHLFLVEYPGNLTEDTFTQISEMVSGSYSNFNTFWHTMILQVVLKIGYFLFSDLNAAVAFFCVIQTMILAAAFTYSLMTMRDLHAPSLLLIGTFLIFGFMPYHLALSITIWKDVLFAAGCLLMLTAWIRILYCTGKGSRWNYIVFVLGSLLLLLARTNGWVIYLVTFLAVWFPMRHNKVFLSLMGSLAVLGWFLLNPMLQVLNVPGGDIVESLSIPIQQVSRVISEGCELTDDELELLSSVVDLEEVPQRYTSWLSDPMKEEIREKNFSYFEKHINEYARLWMRLGIRYPAQYLKAWIDQTKGYWNGGYDYFLYAETITDNPYGVEKSAPGNPIASIFRLYFGLSRHVIFFEPLHSIGLHVWVFFLCFVLCVFKRRRLFVVFVPLIILVLGLCLATPVYCSFRYVYPLFVSFPLLLSATLYIPQP